MRGDFLIGDRTVVPTLNQILYEGQVVRVQPKVMRVLLHLAARRGEVAGREELIREVWPDTFVTDDVLKRCISDLRKALGDDLQTPRFIQTIPKVGYRLLTAVEPVEPQGDAGRTPAPVSGASPPQQELTEKSELQAAVFSAPVTERRYQATLDVKNELQEIKEALDSGILTAPTTPSRRHRGRAVATVAAAIVIIVAAAWLLRLRAAPDLPAMRVVPLTSLNGTELGPKLSPDGEEVVFSWDNGKEGNKKGGWDHFDIYLKLVGSPEVRRLTTDPGRNWAGGWSPDGRQIACLTQKSGPDGAPQPGGSTIYLISPVTGARRKLLDFPATGSPSWTPDGRGLIVAGQPTAPEGGGIYFITVDGGAARLVMRQPKTAVLLNAPAVAPDGHHLAYLACARMDCLCCDLSVVELDDRWQAVSTPRRLANQLGAWGGLAWSRDGASVLYSAGPGNETHHLWRAWVRGNRAPERLELAGLGAHMPALASARNRLAFVRRVNSVSIYTLEATPRPVLASSVWDFQPQFSPDGAGLAFTSSRSGGGLGLEIWLASADGSGPHQLTRGPGRYQGSPSWSPDGRQIAFDSRGDDDRLSIWTIDADGGAPRLITKGPDDRNTPTWSRDGRWIYFLRKEGDRTDTWRVPVAGGSPERVTRDGSAPFAVESMDGHDLIYKRHLGDSPLLAQPLAGGASRQLLPCVSAVNFAVVEAGIFYAACGQGPERSMHLLDKAGRDRVLGSVRDVFGYEMVDRPAVTADGKTVLVHRQSLSNDLMLIENFR
jgi:Tol biopolymer transport system component/DNA-binding winged helix-turn-helix (wHTH) protein